MKQIAVLSLLVGAVGVLAGGAACQEGDIADVLVGLNGVIWQPLGNFAGLSLTVAKPDGDVIQQTFPAGMPPYLDLSKGFSDGEYTWELRALAANPSRVRSEAAAGGSQDTTAPPQALVQSG